MNTIAPQPEGYSCNDPDYSQPLPGEVVHWEGPAVPVRLQPPIGPFADRWDKLSLKSTCPRPRPAIPQVRPETTPPRIY
jgi:hypothetical protein